MGEDAKQFITSVLIVLFFLGVYHTFTSLDDLMMASTIPTLQSVTDSGDITTNNITTRSLRTDTIRSSKVAFVTIEEDLKIKRLENNYTGGQAYVCVSDNGLLFASENPC